MFPRTRYSSGRSTLWANRDFLNLWSAETIAQLGFQLGVVAIPLIAALSLDASPLQMGLLAAAGPAPRLAIGFIAGAWADRLPRRPIMIAMDVGRVFTYAVIPIAALIDHFSFAVLFAVALVGGAQAVFFDAAWSATIPSLVDRRHLPDATGKLMGSASLAQVLGPALGGLLISWVDGPVVMWITAASFAGSAWFLLHIRKPEPRPERPADGHDLWREVREGLHELWGSDIVRPLLTSSIVLNFGGFIFLSVYVLFMIDDLHLSSRGVGFVFASGGVGALIGTVLASRLADRLGIGRSILLGALAFGLSNFLVPLSFFVREWALVLVVTSEFIAWMSLMVFNVNRFALRQALTPDHLRGRVGASSMTLVSGATMLGSLAGGLVGERFSVHTALFIGTIGMFLAAWWVWDSPVRHIVDMPDTGNQEIAAPEPVAA